MRILRVADIPRWPPGGGNRFMLLTGGALEERGHEVEYMFREDLWPGFGRRKPIRRLIGPLLALFAIRRRLKRGRSYDVVEIREADAAPYCLARRLRPASLPACAVMTHGMDELAWRAQRERWRALGIRAPLRSRLSDPLTVIAKSRCALSQSDQTMVLNEAERSFLERDRGLDRTRVSRVNPGVGEAFFSIAQRRGPVRRFVFVGAWGDQRGRDRKGDRELVQGWQWVAKRCDLSLSIVGSGGAPDRVLENFAPDLRGRITVNPSANEGEVREELARADAYVLPSWFEGLPIATLEAAAAGLPCIASDIPGHREIFRPPDPEADGGILVSSQDPVALAKSIERLATDEGLAHRLGANARHRARAFSLADAARQLEIAYLRARRSTR